MDILRHPPVSALVIGDVMLDRYLQGSVHRISQEAPVPVVALEKERLSPGGAGHVAASLVGLGCQVTLGGILGTDFEGGALRTCLLEAGIADLALVQQANAGTLTKTRILAGPQHQLLRLDRDGNRDDFQEAAAKLERQVIPRIAHQDVVVLADYDKGTLPAGMIRRLIKQCQHRGVRCLIDSKKADLAPCAGATLLTPNILETERALGRRLLGAEAVAAAAVELRERLDLEAMLITRGADGMTLASAAGVQHFAAEVRQVADVTGAGDTVAATLALGLALQWSLFDACRLASMAAGIAVSQPGTYVVQAAELARAWQGTVPKLLDWPTARRWVAAAQRAGRRIVFTNGCFDILHAGHLYCLEKARQLGDGLIVGLNSDTSVRQLKGASRPVIGEQHRAALLAGLACVDRLVLFEDTTPEKLIRFLEPDVLVKGGDYDPDQIAGAEFVRHRGGKVVTIPRVEGLSTTAILRARHANPA